MKSQRARKLLGELKIARIIRLIIRSYVFSITCGIVFRRIEEVFEGKRDAGQISYLGNDFDDFDLGYIPEKLVDRLRRSPKRKREEDNTLTNLRKFRRIQLISPSIVLDPVHNGKRVKVYELRSNDWFDLGIGFCTCRLVNVSRSDAFYSSQ